MSRYDRAYSPGNESLPGGLCRSGQQPKPGNQGARGESPGNGDPGKNGLGTGGLRVASLKRFDKLLDCEIVRIGKFGRRPV